MRVLDSEMLACTYGKVTFIAFTDTSDRQMDERWWDRQAEGHICWQTDAKTNGTDGRTNSWTDGRTKTVRQTDKQTDKQADKHMDRQSLMSQDMSH